MKSEQAQGHAKFGDINEPEIYPLVFTSICSLKSAFSQVLFAQGSTRSWKMACHAKSICSRLHKVLENGMPCELYLFSENSHLRNISSGPIVSSMMPSCGFLPTNRTSPAEPRFQLPSPLRVHSFVESKDPFARLSSIKISSFGPYKGLAWKRVENTARYMPDSSIPVIIPLFGSPLGLPNSFFFYDFLCFFMLFRIHEDF